MKLQKFKVVVFCMIVLFLKRLKYYKSYVIVIKCGIFKKMKIQTG